MNVIKCSQTMARLHSWLSWQTHKKPGISKWKEQALAADCPLRAVQHTLRSRHPQLLPPPPPISSILLLSKRPLDYVSERGENKAHIPGSSAQTVGNDFAGLHEIKLDDRVEGYRRLSGQDPVSRSAWSNKEVGGEQAVLPWKPGQQTLIIELGSRSQRSAQSYQLTAGSNRSGRRSASDGGQ